MKKLIPIMLCLALLFVGIAGCATTTEVTQEKPYIVDFRFVPHDKAVKVTSCDKKPFTTIPWLVMSHMSDGADVFSNLVVLYDIDCKDYVLFIVSKERKPLSLGRYSSLEEIRTTLLEELERLQ